ncbi:unnamed protein product [Knipowitschia caucasica]
MESTALLFALLWSASRSGAELVDCDAALALENVRLMEGESLWFIPPGLEEGSTLSWFWNVSQEVLPLSSEETEPVHAHGAALCLLNATQGRTGCFKALENFTGSIIEHYVNVSVVAKNSTKLVKEIEGSSQTIFLSCPDRVSHACQLNGTKAWYKDGALVPGEDEEYLAVLNTGLEVQGRYDCVCSWFHHQHLYRSVGSMMLRLKEQFLVRPLRILSPTEEVQLADAGASLLLNCTVLCGINISPHNCVALWKAKHADLHSEDYTMTKHVDTNPSKQTIVTQRLHIHQLTADHFRDEYQCVGRSVAVEPVSFIVRLQARQSVASLAAALTCVLVLAVLMAVMVKCFMVDLVLLSRRLFPFRLGDTGVKAFDAYVVYQLHSQDKDTEEAVGCFVSQELPRVLEHKYGYKLFIHGRDDLPGEDHVELVEMRIKKSRRLIVVLSPVSGCQVAETCEAPGGYDWQVGLHEALVQRDLNVILVQLGDTGPGGYSRLPPGLQHLTQSCRPLRWSPNARSRANARFWKRVRYLMPASPLPHDTRTTPV